MADISETASVTDQRAQVQRTYIHRVMIDTPALLNMVKHCRDADWKTGAQGTLMGVLKDD